MSLFHRNDLFNRNDPFNRNNKSGDIQPQQQTNPNPKPSKDRSNHGISHQQGA